MAFETAFDVNDCASPVSFRLVLFAIAGFFTSTTPWLFGLALPAMLLGDRLGYVLFRRFATRSYRRVALFVLLLLGLGITLRSFF